MMSNLLPAIAGLLLAMGVSAAAAPLPSSQMPGHERERFTDSPVERFMRAAPYQPPQVIEPFPAPGCDVRKPPQAKQRAGRRKGC
jgi:hypothetical protein